MFRKQQLLRNTDKPWTCMDLTVSRIACVSAHWPQWNNSVYYFSQCYGSLYNHYCHSGVWSMFVVFALSRGIAYLFPSVYQRQSPIIRKKVGNFRDTLHNLNKVVRKSKPISMIVHDTMKLSHAGNVVRIFISSGRWLWKKQTMTLTLNWLVSKSLLIKMLGKPLENRPLFPMFCWWKNRKFIPSIL